MTEQLARRATNKWVAQVLEQFNNPLITFRGDSLKNVSAIMSKPARYRLFHVYPN